LRRTLRGVAADEKEKKLARLQQTVLIELYKKKVVENALNVGDKVILHSRVFSLRSSFFVHSFTRSCVVCWRFLTSSKPNNNNNKKYQ